MRAKTQEWLKALDNALNEGWPYRAKSQGIKLVSDNGSQPTSRTFGEFCKNLEIDQVFTTYTQPNSKKQYCGKIKTWRKNYRMKK